MVVTLEEKMMLAMMAGAARQWPEKSREEEEEEARVLQLQLLALHSAGHEQSSLSLFRASQRRQPSIGDNDRFGAHQKGESSAPASRASINERPPHEVSNSSASRFEYSEHNDGPFGRQTGPPPPHVLVANDCQLSSACLGRDARQVDSHVARGADSAAIMQVHNWPPCVLGRRALPASGPTIGAIEPGARRQLLVGAD